MPRGSSGPISEPTKIPLARYSRDEIAVVSGGTGTCVSSLAPNPIVQPSGVTNVAGGFDGRLDPAGGAPAGGAGAESGSAPDAGAPATDSTRQTPSTAVRRSTFAIGLMGDTVRST